MSSPLHCAAFTWLALCTGVALCPRVARAEETCVLCHSQQRDPRLRSPTEDMPRSVHGKHQITCSQCHGGNPEEPTGRAHEINSGFHAREEAGASPAVCGNCHADAQRQAALHDQAQAERAGFEQTAPDGGLPTDQLSKYLASSHALAFAAGNERAATCSRCHGAHDVAAVLDPSSRVYPGNVASTCGHCHSDPELAAASKLPSDQERQWRHSVHGRAHARFMDAAAESGVLDREARHPPTCNDCHDDHGIAGREAAISGCKKCHADEWKSFNSGPHARAFSRMGFLPCVDCHGNHEIAPARATLIGIDSAAACQRCHAQGQKMWDRIAQAATEVRKAETATREARAALEGEPISTRANTLSAIDEADHKLRLAIHALDTDGITAAANALATRARAVARPEPGGWALTKDAAAWIPALLVLLSGIIALVISMRRGGGKP